MMYQKEVPRSNLRSAEEVQGEIRSFCRRCSEGLSKLSGDPMECIQYIRGELPRLLLDRELMMDVLRNASSGAAYPDVRRQTLFDNELLLHMESQFSLRLYLWGPGEYTKPHDHNSWGVIGTPSHGYGVVNYRREDDGSVEGYAKLVETEHLSLGPGETAFTLPLNEGIHMTGNPTTKTIISLNLYGPPIRRGYLQTFDVKRERVSRIMAPKHLKAYLSAQALRCLEEGNC